MEIVRKSFDCKVSAEEATTGLLHAVVSVFGNVDHDNEVMEPGAFAAYLERAKAKGKYAPGCWMHDWTLPVAKTLEMWENADGLHIIAQFNLDTQIGRETFSNIKHELITEYSIGFSVADSEFKDGRRHIKQVELYEWSAVLHGANSETYTVGLKSDNPHAGLTLEDHFGRLHDAATELITRVESIQEMRAKSGRILSDSRREQIAELKGKLNSLLELTTPKASTEEVEALHIQAAIEIARSYGVHL